MASTPTHAQARDRFTAAILELEKILPWYQGVTLRGYSLSSGDVGWLLVVRVERNGQNLVAFTGGHSPFACWEAFLKAIARKGFTWKKDRFA